MLLPQGLDERRLVFVAVLLAADEVQLHTVITGKVEVGIVDGFTTNDADGVDTNGATDRRGGMNVIGPGATKSQQGVISLFEAGSKIVFELEPFVAAEGGMNQVGAQALQADASLVELRVMQGLQAGRGELAGQLLQARIQSVSRQISW